MKRKCPYMKLEQVFEYCDLVKYRSVITESLHATYCRQKYSYGNPADLVDYFDKIQSLIKATHCINEQNNCLVLEKEVDLLDRKYFYGKHKYLSVWQYIPQSLTEEEYKNPYLVFKPFFGEWSLKKWKKILKLVLRYALSQEMLSVDYPSINILAIHLQLTRLIEAAHLLFARRGNHAVQ